jgi:hypothetical protein
MKLRLKSKVRLALIAFGFIALVFLAIGRTEIPVSLRSREAVLKSDLRILREAIDKYTLDKQQQAQSLQDLVDSHYIREIPRDPITNKADWVSVFGGATLSPNLKVQGCTMYIQTLVEMPRMVASTVRGSRCS